MTPNGFGGKEGQNKKRKLTDEKFKYYQKPHANRSATRVSGFHYQPCASLFD
jgi:hypothetical protein